jgi:hypothetical protein
MPRNRYNREHKPPSVHDLLTLPTGNQREIAAMLSPTLNQLLDLQRDLMTIAERLTTPARQVDSTGCDSKSAISDPDSCDPLPPLPPQIYQRLRWNIVGQILRKPWAKERKELLRWSIIQCYIEDRLSVERACKAAAAALKGTPAAAGPDQMKKTYLKIQKERPPK